MAGLLGNLSGHRAATAAMAALWLAGLAGCSPVPGLQDDGSLHMVVDGIPLKVGRDSSYIRFNPVQYTDPVTGQTSEIEPIPTPPAITVTRTDGTAITKADAARAVAAMQAYCRAGGQAYRGTPAFEKNPAGRDVWNMGFACAP